jgi:hypothetical protein
MKKIFMILSVALSAFYFSCKKDSSNSGESTTTSTLANPSSLRTSVSTTSPLQWQVCAGTTADEFGYSIAKAGDGGYFVAGTTNNNNDGYLVKLGSNHQVMNSVVVGGSGVESLHGIVPTDDGGCLAAGTTSSPETPGFLDANDILLAKFGANGNIEWKKAIGLPGTQQANAIIRTSDGNFVLTGYSDTQLPLIKIDPQGNPLQQSYYSYSSATTANFGYGIVETTDGYIISGWTHVPNNAAEDGLLLVKTSTDGTTSKLARFYTGFDSHGWGIASNATRTEFAVAGNNGNLVVLKVDAQLNKISDKTFNNIDGRTIITTSQGYLVVGTQSNDLLALRIDNSLNAISSNTFGGGRVETGRGVIADSDGGYVAVGTTNSTNGVVSGNHGGNDIWTVKFKY